MRRSAAPKIVGVIFSRADFQRAIRLRTPPDLFELRLDGLVHCLDYVSAAIRRLPAPLIITARDPREGGANNLPVPMRRSLLLRFLPAAQYIDVELKSTRALESVLKKAADTGTRRIISFHDFQTMPAPARLGQIAERGHSLGATFTKVAVRTDTAIKLHILLDFFEKYRATHNVVAMGIGRRGRASRLEFARRGCPLNYGHLGHARVPGQLSIGELSLATAGIREDS